MRRILRACACACAALVLVGLPCRADETAAEPQTLTRLTVGPMAAPKPALRYVLLPELKEINPGNPIQNYMKCFMEQHKFFFDKDAFDRREKLLAMPLKELPVEELTEYGHPALAQAEWAARSTSGRTLRGISRESDAGCSSSGSASRVSRRSKPSLSNVNRYCSR